MVAWRYEISLLVLKKIFHSFAQYFSTLEETFRILARLCNILYVCPTLNNFYIEHWFKKTDPHSFALRKEIEDTKKIVVC